MSDYPIPADPEGKKEAVGWEWFDQAEQQVNVAREKEGVDHEDIQRVYAAVFETQKGKAVLQDLMRFVIDVAAFDPALGFYNGAAYGFHQEGMRKMVVYIDRMVKAGQKAKTQPKGQ